MIKTLQIIALLQGFFVILVLIKNHKTYKKTTFWLLLFCLLSILFYIAADDENNLFTRGADWFLFDSSLFVTFLFLFFKYNKNQKETFQKFDYFFFLPNIIYFIIEAIEIQMAKEHVIIEAIEIGTELIFLVYLALIVYQLIQSKKTYWALYFAFPIAILFSFLIINNILKALDFDEFLIFNDQNFNFYLLLIVAFLFYFLAFNLINKSKAILPLVETNKYKNSNLNQRLIKEYKADLLKSMENDNLYLDSKLSIQDVSDKLNIPRQYISEVLNVHMHINFQDFVNQYRVEEFVERIKKDENDHFTLLGIAKDVGFNSKSSFNAVFKKLKGLTPTQFKNKLQNKSK